MTHNEKLSHPLRTPHSEPNPPPSPINNAKPELLKPKITFHQNQVWLTYALIAVNIIVFILDYLSGSYLTILGMKENASILSGQYWRLLTPVFLHGGILHLAFNNYFLFTMGPHVERAFGAARFAAVYFFASILGVIFSFLLTSAPSIGASGALFGLLGALLPYLYLNKKTLNNADRMLNSVLSTIGINLLIGLSPGIDNWAHLGGIIGGAILSWFIAPVYSATMKEPPEIIIKDSRSTKTILFRVSLCYLAIILLFLLVLSLK